MSNVVSDLQVRVSVDSAAAERDLKSLSQNVTSFGESFKQGLGIGAGVTAMQAGFSAIGVGFGSLKSSVIDFNQQLDASTAVFTRYFDGNKATAESFLNTLKGFAATTPFEFKDLSQFAVRLQNANTNANDIIPTLKAIGNASSATGALSKESMDRITLALTQMQMKGKVTGEEMLQLTEANVPAWNILAEATGKPIAVLQKMASEGKITSDVFIKGFRAMYENAGLMEGASKSLAGALSTVRDVGTQAFADIGRSVYEMATQGANALAGFLSSDDFQAWVNAAKIGLDVVVEGVRGLISALQPVGAVIATAFHQFTAGDFGAAVATVTGAIQTALNGVIETAQAVAQRMFGAGANLINELAGGIVSGASQTLTAAVDTVASTIAAFLIGNSPPPEGPLARIREGGANTIAAWGEGAASAADRAVKPAADAIASNLSELKIAGRDVDASIRDIGQSIQDVEHASRDLKYAADDIKTAYNDQIAMIDDQIKGLQRAQDTQRDREKLELGLEEIQLRQAEIAAMGNKELRAQIQTRLEGLKASTADRKNQEAMADAQQAVAGSEKDRLKAKLDAKKLDDQERDLRERLKKAKPEERSKIRQQLQELGLRRQIEAAEGKEREAAAQRRLQDAEAKQGELSLQQQLNGLVDKEALAAIKTRRDALGLRKEELGLQEQTERIQREIAMVPLKEQRDALVTSRDAMLRPLQEQLETLTRQKSALGEQRQEMQNYKADITAATQGLRDQAAAAKEAAKSAAENAPRPSVDKSFTPDAVAEAAINKAKEAGAKLAAGLRDGFSSMFDRLVPESIRTAFSGISQRLANDGVPGLIHAVGNGLGAAVPVFAGKLAEWYGVFLDWARENQSRLLAKLADLQDSVRDWIGKAAGPIADQFYDWTLAFLTWATDSGPKLLDKLAALGADILQWIGDDARKIEGRLLDWGASFVAWVAPRIPELLTQLGQLGARMVEWMGTNLGDLLDGLGKWASALVEWVAPKVPPLLAELGKLLVNVTGWLIGTALPAIVVKLAEWGVALIEWVAPRIAGLIVEVGKLLVRLVQWFDTDAAPAIRKQLGEWGDAFLAWVPVAIPKMLAELVKLQLKLVAWITTEAVPAITAAAVEFGAGMLEGMKRGLSDNWGSLKDWITENIGKQLPEWMQKLLGIHSPSTVFADMGQNLILGLIAGMESKKGDLLEAAGGLLSFGDLAGGSGSALLEQIGAIASKIGGGDFARAAVAISASETGGGKLLSEVGGTGAQGPFQFDPVGELRNFAKYLGVSVEQAGLISRAQPMLAAQWALENYLGDALREGLAQGLSGAELANFGSQVGQRPYGDNWKKAGEWYRNLFPGYAAGGWAGLHGPELAMLGERGPEYVVPNHLLGGGGGGGAVQEHEFIIRDPSGRTLANWYVIGRDIAIRRAQESPGAL